MASSSGNANGRLPLRLKFVVVGGGIAGLATAFTLQRAGHSVIVLEKLNKKAMSFGAGGPIRAPPNMTRLLHRWGLGPVLSKKSVKCERLLCIDGHSESGGMLSITLNEEFLRDPFRDTMVLVQHTDLLNMLRDLAMQEGVEIRENVNVVQVNADSVTSSVRLETGDIISGDIIVLADGCSSKLRSSVAGYPQNPPLEAAPRVLFVAFSVDISLLEDDESFREVLEPTDWITWIAENTHANTYIVNGLLVGSLSHDYYGVSTEDDEEWSDARDLESYGLDLSPLEPRFRKILQLSKTIASRTFLKKSMPEELVNEASSVVLVGEAAHPLLCENMYGTALTIEDAETLGALLSGVESRAQVNQLMMAYEDIRLPRCARMYQHHWHLDSVFKYPKGPKQEMRDSVLRRTFVQMDWDIFDATCFQATLGVHLTSFAYDATEAVEDFWRTSESENTSSRRSPVQVWITQE